LIQHLGTTITAANSTTTYAYDTAGNLATMTDPKGNRWQYTYDLQGNLDSSARSDGHAKLPAWSVPGASLWVCPVLAGHDLAA